MHEMSLALDVCRIAEEYVGLDRLSDVRVVGLEVGDDAGIEIDSFEFCLEAVFAAPPFGRARAAIERSAGDVLRVTYLEVEDADPDDRDT